MDSDDSTRLHPRSDDATQFAKTVLVDDARALHAQSLPVGFRLDEFEVTAKLGEGGFGIVYRVWDHSLGCARALKEYMPASFALRGPGSTVVARSEKHQDVFEQGLERFVKEAQTLAGFDHPSLVRVLRRWQANGTAYLVMPLYEGATFRDHVRRLDHKIDEAWLLGVLDALTQGLAVVHAADWLHRDVAPDNIILLDDGRPVLIDFGAARQVIGDLTQDLTSILKPGYAPVEQYGETPGLDQGPWTDVYALAATVYWAITRRAPAASVSRVLVDNCIPLAQAAAGQLSPGLLLALDKALRVAPKERTQGMAEFRADLGLQTSGPAQRLERTAPPSAQPAKARSWRWGALGAVVVVAGLVTWRLAPTGVQNTAAPAPPPKAVDAGAATTPPQKPAPVAPAPAAFDPQVQFEAVLAQHTPGFDVQAVPTKTSLSIRRGDALKFDITSNRDGYVAVLLLGPDGAVTRLFANPADPPLRVTAGQRLRLPAPTAPQLVSAEPTGAEVVLVIVSASPRDHAFMANSRQASFLELHTGDAAAAQLKQWTRGVPLLLGQAPSCASGDCDAYGAASFKLDVVP